jgi:isopenicillin-N epimerase
MEHAVSKGAVWVEA